MFSECKLDPRSPASLPPFLSVLISYIDASKFLAQSQSRLSFAPNENPRSNNDRPSRPGQSGWRSSAGSRPYLQRVGNPYQTSASQVSHFPFASRLTAPQQAPLFYSATDEFREENDEEEHEREVADLYALQKSRRQFGGSELNESSEVDDDDDGSRSLEASGEYHDDRPYGRGGGIRSSWRGGVTSGRGRGKAPERLPDTPEDALSQSSTRSKGKLVDVGLESTIRSPEDSEDDEPPDFMEDPPSIQQFRKPPRGGNSRYGMDSSFIPQETAHDALLSHPRPPSSTASNVPPGLVQPSAEPPKHDAFFGHVYLLGIAAVVATWFLVYLHTEAPSTGQPLGDTIYTTLHASFYLLLVDTVVSIFVALFWLVALKSYSRPLVYLMLIAVPIILYSFSLYSLIWSFKGRYNGSSLQDKVMRFASSVPAIIATLWIYSTIQARHSLHKAISILEFATRILGENPALLGVGFALLFAIVASTWIWLAMFTRVFLGGHLSTTVAAARFIIDASTWWLGVFFILMYLWTLSVLSGLQRAITGATVSQWYFHRLAIPAPTSLAVVQAATTHATTTLFGTVALSTLLRLLIRLPLLILPRRFAAILTAATYSFIPSPVAALINPLSLTYASIHSQPLSVSARALSNLTFLSPTDPSSSLHPNTFSNRRTSGSNSLGAYRLAILILNSSRLITSLALAYGGWVTAARQLRIQQIDTPSTTVRGSLYAYLIALIAGAIGWGILSAVEGVVSGIVDALVICWGSEVGGGARGMGGRQRGVARYCREAGWLFGDEDDLDQHIGLP